jgi:hypothetical protein
MSAGIMGSATMSLQAISPSFESTTKKPMRYPTVIPIVMKSWLRVPHGPPIYPGSREVRYVGTMMVLIPATIPKRILENAWSPTDRFRMPTMAAKMVR